MSAERSMPFYCPYCGDENLRPHGRAHGEWECHACRRVFTLSFRGLLGSTDAHAIGGAPDAVG